MPVAHRDWQPLTSTLLLPASTVLNDELVDMALAIQQIPNEPCAGCASGEQHAEEHDERGEEGLLRIRQGPQRCEYQTAKPDHDEHQGLHPFLLLVQRTPPIYCLKYSMRKFICQDVR